MLLSTEIHDALHTVRYRRPSSAWTDALPVGNGLRGAMSAGLVGGERLWLNDATAWSGLPDSDPMAGIADRGPDALDAVRVAIDDGDIGTAETLLRRQQSPWAQAYLPLATLEIEVETDAVDNPDLHRTLDFTTGIAAHSYETAAGLVRHETWADAVTGAIMHRVAAETPVRVSIRVDSLLRVRTAPTLVDGALSIEWWLPVDVAPGHEHPPEPIRYDTENGRVGAVVIRSSTLSTLTDGMLRTEASAQHTFTIGTATSSAASDSGSMPTKSVARTPGGPSTTDVDAVRAAHIAAHRELYSRCAVELPSPAEALNLDTDERIRRAEQHPDPGLAALVFHYGRYLLMSSSRPGGPPANLQGIWNAELPGPWSSAYTTNINLQMAYWPAEITGLPECHLPLLRFVTDVSRTSGQVVAQELYGADGWVLHHNSDLWGHAAPVGAGHGDPAWAFWPLGGVWLALHLWERHRFGGDLHQLAEDWPVLEQTARFALSWIQSDGLRAWTSPSTSPENQYLGNGNARGVGISSTMDVMLLRELADVCAHAATALGRDDAWVNELLTLTAMLPDPQISDRGMLREWVAALEDADPHHRHLSHLIGLFPFTQITPEATPELAAAAGASIVDRGADSTGWALAWRAAMWARLGDGERVHQQVQMALRPAEGGEAAEHRGGLYRNLFSAHPPFQIDGNLGFTAAIAEALVQSDEDSIRVLPALPPQWPNGSVHGIRTRAGVTVDVEWTQGVATRIALRSAESRSIRVTAPGVNEPGARDVIHRVDPGEPTIIESKEPG